MKEYTHVLVEFFVNQMDVYRKYSESERIVITYGLELLFNNSLKLIVYLIIGVIFNVFVETVMAVFVLAILRIMSGGYHSRSDFGCLFMTGLILFSPIIVSKEIYLSKENIIIILIGIAMMYLIFAPNDEKYNGASRRDLIKVKIDIIFVLLGICLGSLLISAQLGIIAIGVSWLQGLSLIKGDANNVKKKNH